MIQKLQVNNFQSHEKTELELAPGVNVFIGQSDSGKTAVLRALDWALNNRPQGDEYRREGTDTTTVRVETDTHTITRWKRKTVDNCYSLLNKAEADGEDGGLAEFKAFGAAVPEEISAAVNMLPINWQRQLDAPFLLSETAGEVARTLNEIVRLDVIDRSMSHMSGKVRDNSQNIRSAEEQEAELKGKAAEFNYLDEVEPKVAQVEVLSKQKDSATTTGRELDTVLRRMEHWGDVLRKAEPVLKLEQKIKALEDLEAKWKDLQRSEQDMVRIGRAVKEHRDTLRSLPDFPAAEKMLKGAEDREGERIEMTREETTLSNLLYNIITKESIIKGMDSRIEELKRQIKEMEAEAPVKICPTCGQEVPQ